MPHGSEFSVADTPDFLEAENFEISRTSAFMSVQREGPYSMYFGARSDLLINVVNSDSVKAKITVDGRIYAIEGGPGTITVVPARKPFRLELETGVETTHLYIRRKLLDQVIATMFPDGQHVEIQFCACAYDPVLEKLCLAIREALHEASKASAQYVEHMLLGAAAYLVRHYSTATPRGDEPISSLSDWQVMRTREIVEARLGENIALADIACEFRLSADHFGRLFKRASGVTLYQYIIRCRVERAQKMLSETETPIVDIAGECGFADQVHLTRAFGRLVGVTPAVYRRTKRGR
jgi:AraC family transcriptional regulator